RTVRTPWRLAQRRPRPRWRACRTPRQGQGAEATRRSAYVFSTALASRGFQRRAVLLFRPRILPAVRIEVALDRALALLRKDRQAQWIEEQEQLGRARSRHCERTGEGVALDHMRDRFGTAEVADDAARLERVVESRDRGELAVLLHELDDLGRIVHVHRGEEVVQAQLDRPQLGVDRNDGLGDARHGADVIGQIPLRLDRKRRDERDGFDLEPLRIQDLVVWPAYVEQFAQ